VIGSILVKVGFAAALASAVLYYWNARKHSGRELLLARAAFHTSVVSLMTAAAYLLYLILTHQFQYTYVWNYSSTDLPLSLLISTLYAGQEGSFTLWALYTAVIGVFLIPFALIGTVCLGILPLVGLIYGVVGAIETSQGKDFKYWLVGDWARGLL